MSLFCWSSRVGGVPPRGYGWYNGVMDDERNTHELMAECARLLRIVEKRTRPPVPEKTTTFKHGTMYGYKRHLDEGTECDDCRAANAEHQREKRRRRRERDLIG